MRGFKLFLVFGLFMCVVKPFAGFSLYNSMSTESDLTILAKSFTQRWQEYTEGSEYDVKAVQHRLADSPIFSFLLFSFFLSILFPSVIGGIKSITNRIISEISLSRFHFQQLYLLSGKLSI